MSVQIRHGVFETNSSSMHTIAVRKQHGNCGTEKIYLHNGMKSVYSDDLSFERYPFRILYSLMDKAMYAVASYLGGYRRYEKGDEDAKKFLEGELYPIIRKYYPDFVGIDFDVEEEDVYVNPKDPEDAYCRWDEGVEYTGDGSSPSGYSLVKEDGTKIGLVLDEEHYVEVMNCGNVDHQSSGLLQGFLKQSGVSLEEFLTDSAYVVVIDGDEYNDFCKYLTAGLMRVDDFESVYTTDGWWGYSLSDEDKKKLKINPVPCDC